MAQRLQRLFERGQRLPVRRPPLGLDRGLPEIGRGLVPHLPAAEVVGDQLDDVADPPGVQLLEAVTGRRVVLTSPALQHARVHHVLGERVLEAVHQLGFLRAREDEVEGMQLPEVPGHLLRDDLEDARDQRNSEASSHHRRPWSVCLSGSARRSMRAAMMSWMVAGTVTSGAAQPRLALLDDDPARLHEAGGESPPRTGDSPRSSQRGS